VVGFIPNELIIVEFAQSWLETLQAKLEDEAPQAAQKNINLQTLRNLELRVPPVELQRTFAARVAEIRAMGAEQAASRRRLDDLFQSLLHRAFQGEL
jgi:type I restriction enzyme S subunit